MSIRPITDTLRLLQGGLFLDTCSEQLAELVKGVDETGKAGKLMITLDLKKSSGAIEIVAKVTNRTPEPKADGDLLWDVHDLDRWIETLKNDVGDDASAIVARLE